MNEIQKFRAVIEDAGDGGAYVTIPFDVEKIMGKKRVKVKALIEGELYHGSLVRMGSPHHMLPILKAIREKIGKSIGDEIEVEVQEDTEPRTIALSADVLQALESNPQALSFFNQLAYSHQKEYVQWIEEAKRGPTRLDRITRMIEALKQGKKERG